METAKPLEFKGTAGGYFVLALISIVLSYIPFFGWAYLLNYGSSWLADNTLVNGKKITYKASYGESLKFMLIHGLILVVTFGIYMFWFVPKMYRYMVGHAHYTDEGMAGQPAQAPVVPVPVNPVDPVVPPAAVDATVITAPVEPTPPVDPTDTPPQVG